MKRSTIVEIISALFILLFVYTAVSKINEFNSFSFVLIQFPLLSKQANLIAWFIPLAELLVSLLLLLPVTRTYGLLGSAILMLLFTFYISYLMLFAAKLPCSCGGVLKQLTWGQHLAFNIVFTGLAITGCYLNRTNKYKMFYKTA